MACSSVCAVAQLRDLLRAEGLAEKDSGEQLRSLDNGLGDGKAGEQRSDAP
jgi:hypothetical protein